MANAFSTMLFLLALGALIMAIGHAREGDMSEFLLTAIGTAILGASGYAEWTASRGHYGNAVGAVIFGLAILSFVFAGREFMDRFENDRLSRRQKTRCLGYALSGGLCVAAGVCQFLYVV